MNWQHNADVIYFETAFAYCDKNYYYGGGLLQLLFQ